MIIFTHNNCKVVKGILYPIRYISIIVASQITVQSITRLEFNALGKTYL